MKRSLSNGISWKTKKHIAEVLCVVVVVLSMTLSLYFQAINNSDDKKDSDLVEQSASVKVGNYGNSASLKMDSSTVQDAAEPNTDIEAQEEFAAATSATPNKNSGNVNGIKRNHVVSNIQRTGTNAPNQVVENTAGFSLITGIFENYGTELEWDEAGILYQYPVELGYPVDNNYDGKQTEKGIVQEYVFDTATEDELYSDNRDEEDQTDESEDDESEEPATEATTTEEIEDTTEETVVGDSDDSTQDGEESGQDNEDKKVAAVIDRGFQKKVMSKLLPTEPVQVDISVKNVKKNVKKSAQKNTKKNKKNTNFIEAMVEVLKHKMGMNVEEDTEVPTDEEVVEEDTEAPTNGETVEEDTEASSDGETVGKDTEAPTGGETVKTEEETQMDGDNIEKTPEDNRMEADSSFFVISGKMRVDSQVFVSDIKVKPTGKDGFNLVRMGEQGDFQSSVTLTEDAAEKEVTLYFSDGVNETTGVTFAYSKDTSNPSMTFNGASCNILHGSNANFYCTNDAELELVLEDGSNGTGVDKVCFAYGDRVVDFTNIADGSKAALSQDFYGRVLMNCADKAGNVSSVLSEYILLDRATPTIEFSQDEFCTTPYTLWIDVADNGSIVSGLADVACTVNGEPIELTNLDPKGIVKLDDDLEVPQKVGFSIPFEEEGEFVIQVMATDYAGNATVQERNITVTKPEFVSVFMPETFTIHIDPQRLLEQEQIFSDAIELTNVSEFDVEVTVDSIELYVNDEVSPEGIEKDCEIYFVTPDTGEKIKIEKGENKDVYSYCLPVNATGDIANLYFVGSTTEGSDKMWQSSDISIVVNLTFRKWRGE